MIYRKARADRFTRPLRRTGRGDLSKCR